MNLKSDVILTETLTLIVVFKIGIGLPGQRLQICIWTMGRLMFVRLLGDWINDLRAVIRA